MPPRRAASTSRRQKRQREASPPPPPLPWELSTPSQFQRYKVLAKRTIIPSKFFDTFTVHNLGLRREVNALLQNMGWTQFAGIHFPTYSEVTFEILSTVQAKYNPYEKEDQGEIRFRCLGDDRLVSLAEFNFLFGFPNEGFTWTPVEFIPDQAWYRLTGQRDYNPSLSKASFLRSHALRYIHRVMSLSIFGRGESTGVVNKVELMFLWAMSNNIKVNTGAWFLRHLLHVARASTGKICIGGLLSVIADAYGFVPQEGLHHVVAGSHLVDIDTLLHMRMCRQIEGGQFRLLDNAGQVLHQDEAEEEDEAPVEEEHVPDYDAVDMGGFPNAYPEHQPEAGPSSTMPDQEFYMSQVMERFERLDTRMTHSEDMQRERFERLETRMTRSEEMQMQMLQLMQQNSEATARIEDKLSHWK